MACKYTFEGNIYEAHEFDDILRGMSPEIASKYMPSVKNIPSSPFINKTDAWVSLALKRMVRYASENSFDKVAIINGQQAADLYDISKQISEASARANGDGTYSLTLEGKNGQEIDGYSRSGKSLTPEELENTIGKDVAKKLIEGADRNKGKPWPKNVANNPEFFTLRGLDLKVGGEGMRTFYDQILPKVAKDVLKKLGGELSKTTINGQEKEIKPSWTSTESETKTAPTEQLSFTITPAMRDKVMQGLPLFSSGNLKKGMPIDKVEAFVADFSKGWKRKPQVIVVDSMQDEKVAPSVRNTHQKMIENGSTGLPIGFISQGKVYIMAPMVNDAADVAEVMMHEIFGHAGLRGNFGNALDTILNQIWVGRRKDVVKKAKGYGLPVTMVDAVAAIKKSNPNLSDFEIGERADAMVKRNRLTAAEEVLAEMAQTNPELGFVKRAIAAIRAWLRKNIAYFKDLEITDADIIANILMPARNFIKSGKAGGKDLGNAVPVFSMKDQTNTPEFKKWFGDSKVVDADGKPLVVYHGTGESIKQFDDINGRGAFYFTPSIKFAESFARTGAENLRENDGYNEAEWGAMESAGANILPVYLSAKNLFDPRIPAHVDRLPLGKGAKDAIATGDFGTIQDNIPTIKKAGFDGFYETEDPKGELWNIAVFEPTQIKSAIGNNGNFDGNNDDIRFSLQNNLNDDIPAETKAQAIQRIGQDKFNRFKVLQDWLVENGLELSEGADVYQAETLMSGRISTRKEDFREGQVKELIKETQDADLSMETIGDFLKVQHAPEANKRARELQGKPDATAYGVSDAEASAAMDEFRALPNFAELRKIANKWRNITEQTKQIKIDSGLLTPEMVAAWENTYEMYVPVKGNDDAGTKSGTGKGLDVKVRNKQRLGHGLRDEAIIENILRDHEAAISLDEKNRVGKALIKFALEAKNDDIVTIGKPEKRKVLKQGDSAYMVNYYGSDVATFESLNEARAYVRDAVLKGSDKKGFDIQKTSDPVRVMLQVSPQLAENEVTVYVGGHAVRIQINDEVAAREYKNMGVEHLNTILSAGREVNNWLSKVYTGYSPDFIFTNPIRDAIQGAITLTGNLGAVSAAKIYTNYPSAVKELVKHFRNKGSSALVTDYRNSGGSTGGAYLSDLERIGDDIQAAYNEYQGALATYKSTYDKAIDAGKSKKAAHAVAALKAGTAGFKKIPIIGHFLKLMENINAITENALRVATYKTLTESGVSKGKAAAQAKNLMNFNRKGEQSNAAGALYLFFNPAVQGTKLIQEALTTSPHKRQAQALAGSMTLMAFTVAMMALSGDEEDKDKWNKTPDHIKDGNIVFDMFGTQVTITLPYGYRVFWTLGNIMADATQKGANFAKLGNRLAASLFANFSPIGNPMEGENGLFQLLPTTPKMVLASGVNEDSFGRPITPKKWNQATPDSQLMNRGTHGSLYDGVSQKLNELSGGGKYESGMVDVSPETFKFLVKSLLGGTGQFAFDSINIVNQGAQGVAPQDVRDIPIARRFVRETGVSDARQAFWDRKNEADMAADQFALAKKAQDRDALMELKDKNGALIIMSKVSDKMLKMANAKRDAIGEIKLDESLSLKEKISLIKALEAEEEEVYNNYISMFDDRIKQ
jgi:hypothetical protein